VSFFDDFPQPPEPPEPPIPERKPWMGAPPGWVGGWVPWHIVLVKTPDLLAVISGVEAYPTGVTLSLTLRARPDRDDDIPPFAGPRRAFFHGGVGGPRIGIGFADGRKAVLGRFHHTQEEPEGPLLLPGGGGGGGEEWHTNLWLWPLPPPGPLQLVVAWESEHVEERTFDLDATELTTAAERAEKLWDYDPNEVARRRIRRFPGPGSVSGVTFAMAQPKEPPPSAGDERPSGQHDRVPAERSAQHLLVGYLESGMSVQHRWQ